MGTQHSSRHSSGLPLRASPRSSSLVSLRHAPGSSSALRSLGFDEAESPFASPPRSWHSDGKCSSPKASSSSPKGASRWRSRSCQAPSSSTASTVGSRADSPDIEAGKADLELDSAQRVADAVISDGRHPPSVDPKEEHQIVAVTGRSSKVAHRSSSSSCKTSAQLTDITRPSLAKGSSVARPRWSRPRPQTAGSSRPSSSGSMESVLADHPHSLTNDEQADDSDPSFSAAAGLGQLVLPGLAEGKVSQWPEPPPTPSTISDSSFYCTQSSFSSGSSWSSRPNTRSSASSSSEFRGGCREFHPAVPEDEDEDDDQHEVLVNCTSDSRMRSIAGTSSGSFWNSSRDQQLIAPAEDRHERLVDCTRDSRLRASGTRIPNAETLQRMSSVKTAWGSEMVDDA